MPDAVTALPDAEQPGPEIPFPAWTTAAFHGKMAQDRGNIRERKRRMNILVSACLLGVCCRYNETGEENERVKRLGERHRLIPVCPEIYGGLATPRPPAERVGERVLTKDGTDVTAQYEKGAKEALRLARYFGCTAAVLKSRSPSCGKGRIHDGTFSDGMTDGNGVAAELLEACGIRVLDETDERLETL